MATDKRQFTLRLREKTYEKIRYLAYAERRSIAMEIEHAVLDYIAHYEADRGPIVIPDETPEESV